jgi:hypothetical protein
VRDVNEKWNAVEDEDEEMKKRLWPRGGNRRRIIEEQEQSPALPTEWKLGI